MKNNIVVKMEYGSHLYGLNHAGSDTDYKAIALPTAEQIIMQEADFFIKQSTGDQHSKNEAGDIDDEVMSLSKFLKQAMAGKNTAIDMLHASPAQVMITSDIWEELQSKRHMFYTKDMSTYVDYVQGQAAKYGVKGSRLAALQDAMDYLRPFVDDVDGKAALEAIGVGMLSDCPTTLGEVASDLPIGEHAFMVETKTDKHGEQQFYEICQRKFDFKNKIAYVVDRMQQIYDGYGARAQKAKDNKGIDWKAVSHAVRAGYQAKHIYQSGTFSYPLPETSFIMDIKMGRVDYLTGVQPVIEELVAEVEVLAKASTLPETCDIKYWNNWLYRKHLQIVKDSV